MKSLLSIAILFTLFSVQVSANYISHITPEIGQAICKSIEDNDSGKLNRIMKTKRLKADEVLQKVSCSNKSILAYSQKLGSNETTTYLNKKLR